MPNMINIIIKFSNLLLTESINYLKAIESNDDQLDGNRNRFVEDMLLKIRLEIKVLDVDDSQLLISVRMRLQAKKSLRFLFDDFFSEIKKKMIKHNLVA